MIDGTCKGHATDNQTASEKDLEFVVCARKENLMINVSLQVHCSGICQCKGKCQNEITEPFFISDEELDLNNKTIYIYINIYI